MLSATNNQAPYLTYFMLKPNTALVQVSGQNLQLMSTFGFFIFFLFSFLSQCHQWKTRPKFPNRRKIRPLLFHFCSVFLFTSPPLYRNNRYIESNIRSFALPSCHWYHHHLKVVPTHFGFSHLHYYSPPRNLPLSSGSLTAMLGNLL